MIVCLQSRSTWSTKFAYIHQFVLDMYNLLQSPITITYNWWIISFGKFILSLYIYISISRLSFLNSLLHCHDISVTWDYNIVRYLRKHVMIMFLNYYVHSLRRFFCSWCNMITLTYGTIRINLECILHTCRSVSVVAVRWPINSILYI